MKRLFFTLLLINAKKSLFTSFPICCQICRILLRGQDPTTEHEILPHLLKFSSRLIFDSECADNLQRFSGRILALADSSPINLVDLNWVRMKGWRDAFDEVFDTPGRLEQLSLAKKVSITFNARTNDCFHKGAIQALYLQAWLAAQLQWKLRHLEPGDPITRIIYFNGVNDTEVELRTQVSEAVAPGSILGVDIEGGYDHQYCLKQKPRNAASYCSYFLYRHLRAAIFRDDIRTATAFPVSQRPLLWQQQQALPKYFADAL